MSVKIKKIIPNIKNREKLEEIWNDVYSQRRKKVGKKRAIVSANAVVKSEVLKDFINEERKKNKRKIKTITITEEEKKYNDYQLGNVKVLITTEKSVLDEYPNAERKGKLKEMEDPYEREVLSKLLDNYELTLHPEMYYVITGVK